MSARAETISKPGRRPTPVRLPLPAACFAASALIYLAVPAARFNFDGVACAIAVELGELRNLVHGNHLTYGALGWLFHLLLNGFADIRAIVSLQVFSSLLGAAGVAAFCAALLRFGFAPAAALSGSMGLAVSHLYWTWSLESQVYPLGGAFLLWTAAELARERPRPAVVGVLHAGAALGHIGNAMFGLPILLFLKDADSRRRYAIAVGAAFVLSYAAAMVLFVRPSSLDDVRYWLLGSSALTYDKSFRWQGGYSWTGVGEWISVSLRLFNGKHAAGAFLLPLAVWGAVEGWRRGWPAARLAVLWLPAYAVLYLTWQPFTVVYRYTDVPALWILLLCAARAAGQRWPAFGPKAQAGAAAAVAVWLGAWNLTHTVGPQSDPSANRDLRHALWLAREAPEDSWIVVDHLDVVYVPYFAGRASLQLKKRDDPQWLLERVSTLRADGRAVYAVPERLPGWANEALASLGWTEVSSSETGRLFLIK